MTKIGANAFQGCDRLETLTIPENVTMIDCGAFHSCERLGSMTIPASVAKIGPNAFDNCGELTEVTMLGERPEAPNAIFNNKCGKLKAIHVPANAKSWAGMKDWLGIPLLFDAAGQVGLPRRQSLVGPRRPDGPTSDGPAKSGSALGRLRERRAQMAKNLQEEEERRKAVAEKENADKAAAAEERERQKQQLMLIQEELRRNREAREAREREEKPAVQEVQEGSPVEI